VSHATNEGRGMAGGKMRRIWAVVLAITLVLTANVGSAMALSTQRLWQGAVGTNAANGRVSLRAYTNTTGLLTLSLKSMKASASYALEIRAGTCSSLGAIRATFARTTSTARGEISTSRNISGTKMSSIWKVARTGSIVFRTVSGSQARCAALTFPVATRIVVSSLGIDLPVIKGPAGYPPCRVAMYMREFSQPREPGVSLIFAHARTGMFLPFLTKSKINNGAGLIGLKVKVYTSDSKVSTYQIVSVRRHVTSLQSGFGVTSERLWIYTSEGPNSSYPKLIVTAKRLSTASTTYAASHPRARPVAC
jgi:hypothetical protein